MYELVGMQHLNFTGQDGNLVEGVKLHFLDDTNPHVNGKACMTQFIRSSHPCYESAVKLNYGKFEIRFGYGGRIVALEQK